MSLVIEVSENGRSRLTTDSHNPLIYIQEYKCSVCGKWFNEDEIIWANDDGTLSTDTGKPYCEGNCPEQPDYY